MLVFRFNKVFSDDAARTAHLFELYLKKTEGLLTGKRGREEGKVGVNLYKDL